MSFQEFEFKETNYRNLKTVIKKQQEAEIGGNPKDYQCEEGELVKKVKQGKKKKIKKEEENEGIRIARQKKIQYLFKNICNPNGIISVESLGRALVKHRIEFSVGELQQMMVLCKKDEIQDEESLNFDNQEIHETIKNMEVDYERFQKFYEEKF